MSWEQFRLLGTTQADVRFAVLFLEEGPSQSDTEYVYKVSP